MIQTLHHLFAFFQMTAPWTYHINLYGTFAIGIFYAISGFGLTLGYGRMTVNLPCSGAIERFDKKAFMIKRLTRLYPLYLLTNVIDLHYRIYVDTRFRFNFLEFTSTLLVTTSWIRVPWLGLEYTFSPYAGHLWCVSTFVFFYLCFPWVLAVLQRVGSRRVRLVAFCLSAIYGACGVAFLNGSPVFMRFYDTAWWHLLAFAVGCCAGLEVKDKAADLPVYEPVWQAGDGLIVALFAVYIASVVLLNTNPEALTQFTSFLLVPHPRQVFWGLFFMPLPLYFILVNVSFQSASAMETRSQACGVRRWLPLMMLRSDLMGWLSEISMPVYMIHAEVFQFGQHFCKGLQLPMFMTAMLSALLLALVLAHIEARFLSKSRVTHIATTVMLSIFLVFSSAEKVMDP